MIQKVEPFKLGMPKIVWALAIGLIGCLFMSCIDIPKSEIFIFMTICCILVGAAFFEEQKDGRIPEKSKTIALMINSLGLGISLGCLIFAPGFCWKFFSLVLMAITACSIVALYFVVEGVRE